MIDTLGYFNVVSLEKAAAVIVTGSGSVQNEAFFHRILCGALLDDTKWIERVKAGWNGQVALTIPSGVFQAVGTSGKLVEPYGHGEDATMICNVLADPAHG